jgi:hypothetical protein
MFLKFLLTLLYKSPFQFPTDAEVFLTKEQEKYKIKEEKSKMAKLKIWDKKTASTNRPLKRYKNNELPSIDISTDKQRYDIFNTKQRGLIDKALAIVKERSEVPQPKKENISTFLRQKKEMFLVEMSNNIVKEEIEKIREITMWLVIKVLKCGYLPLKYQPDSPTTPGRA